MARYGYYIVSFELCGNVYIKTVLVISCVCLQCPYVIDGSHGDMAYACSGEPLATNDDYAWQVEVASCVEGLRLCGAP